jgi:signal transduction histidine kinase
LNQPTVLLICRDAEFSRAVTTRWERRHDAPAFTVAQPDLCQGITAQEFDLAICGAMDEAQIASVLETLRRMSKPVVVVNHSGTGHEHYSRAAFLPRTEGWQDVLVVVASEMLARNEAAARAVRAEQARAKQECHATLGKYMLEMRHTLNNALTSVLGNSELMLLEPGSLSAPARLQVETIRTMAVRMHEILQRFTSIEKELNAVEPRAGEATQKVSRAAARSM